MRAWWLTHVARFCDFMSREVDEENESYLCEFWFASLYSYLKNIAFVFRIKAWLGNSLVSDGCGALLCFYWWRALWLTSYLSEFPFISLHFYLKNIAFMHRWKAQVVNSLALNGCSAILQFYKWRTWSEESTIHLWITVHFLSFLSQKPQICV